LASARAHLHHAVVIFVFTHLNAQARLQGKAASLLPLQRRRKQIAGYSVWLTHKRRLCSKHQVTVEFASKEQIRACHLQTATGVHACDVYLVQGLPICVEHAGVQSATIRCNVCV
jgi:hypothetical protein